MNRHITWLVLLAVGVMTGSAHAITVTLDSLTMLPGNTPTGVYTTPGAGTSSWDSELSVLTAAASGPNVIGGESSVRGRYAFATSSDIDGPATADQSFDGQIAFRAVVTIANDDPVNDWGYEVNMTFSLSGGKIGTSDENTNASIEWGYSTTMVLAPDNLRHYGEPDGVYGFSRITGGGSGSTNGIVKGAISKVPLYGTNTDLFHPL